MGGACRSGRRVLQRAEQRVDGRAGSADDVLIGVRIDRREARRRAVVLPDQVITLARERAAALIIDIRRRA